MDSLRYFFSICKTLFQTESESVLAKPQLVDCIFENIQVQVNNLLSKLVEKLYKVELQSKEILTLVENLDISESQIKEAKKKVSI